MQHINPLNQYGNELSDLPEETRFVEFQIWANYIRENMSGACTNEHLMCPMLWCRSRFKDRESTAKHLSRCDQRQDAWYWCPQCSRPECFMDRRQAAVRSRSHVTGKKTWIRRRAVRFLKNLGRTSRTKDAKVGQAQDPETVIQGFSGNIGYSEYQKFGLIGSSVIQATPPAELAIPERCIYEMARHTQLFSEMSTGSSCIMNLELPGSSFATPELDTSGLDIQTAHGCSELGVSSEKFPNVSTTSHRSSMKTLSSERSDLSHLRATPMSSFEEKLFPDSDPQSLTPLITSFGCKENEEKLACVPRDVSNSEMSSFLDLEEDMDDQGDHLSTLEHVEWLREFFTVVESDWQQKLSSMSDLLPTYSELSGRSMFELGITSLKQFYEGMPAYTFDQIFALMHVACAYAYILHGSDKSYCWDKLYRDMLPWQCLIFERSGQLMLIRVVERLMGSRSTSEPESHALDMSDYNHLMLLLKEGRILQNCSTFLAGKDTRYRSRTRPPNV